MHENGSTRTQVLYRMYDHDQRLLYVGISVDVGGRFTDHQGVQSWWSRVDTIKLEHFPSRRAVLDAERVAIQTELPLHNVAMSTTKRGRAPSSSRAMRPVNMRVPAEDWVIAMEIAELSGENMPDLARAWLGWYNREPGAVLPRPDPVVAAEVRSRVAV